MTSNGGDAQAAATPATQTAAGTEAWTAPSPQPGAPGAATAAGPTEKTEVFNAQNITHWQAKGFTLTEAKAKAAATTKANQARAAVVKAGGPGKKKGPAKGPALPEAGTDHGSAAAAGPAGAVGNASQRLNPQHAAHWVDKGLTLAEAKIRAVEAAQANQARAAAAKAGGPAKPGPTPAEAGAVHGSTAASIPHNEGAEVSSQQPNQVANTSNRLDPQNTKYWEAQGFTLTEAKAKAAATTQANQARAAATKAKAGGGIPGPEGARGVSATPRPGLSILSLFAMLARFMGIFAIGF